MHPGDEGCEWLHDGMNAMRGSYERPTSPSSYQASNPPTWQHAKLISPYPLHVQVPRNQHKCQEPQQCWGHSKAYGGECEVNARVPRIAISRQGGPKPFRNDCGMAPYHPE